MMRETTADRESVTSMQVLDFADDITLLSNNHRDIQEKIHRLTIKANSIGPQVNTKKTKLVKQNTKITRPITANHMPVIEIKEFI